MAFVHLHNHTEYSLLDGATKVKDMVKRAADLGMPAVAITDHGVMSGIPELEDACNALRDEDGKRLVKPIFGCEIYFTTDEQLKREGKPRLYHMILLAKTNEGYHNLVKLCSESHVDNFYYKPRTTFSMLQKYGKGLIGTTACIAGIVPRLLDNGQFQDAVDWTRKLASCFDEGDFYVELQDQGVKTDTGKTQHDLNELLCRVAVKAECKTIATNDFHYLTHEDAAAQDLMLCIGTGSQVDDVDRMRFSTDQFYMKTEEEMREALKDFPEACDNTVEIAEKCNVTLERDSILPKFPVPEGESEVSWFRHECEKGLVKRYGEGKAANLEELRGLRPDVVERYEHESGVIIKQGFAAYFLIVQEYIIWAKNHGIGVGPGRGSAAGSIVTYAMEITDLDPLPYGLLFERFLSEERVEMPDIDVDFDDAHRQDVIEHVREFYGEDHIAGVITFGKLQAKNAVRDAARVLGYSYGVGDRLCKLIGDELGIKIKDAIATNPDLKNAYENEPDSKRVLENAMSIEGNVRGEGVHACATIICRDPMADHVPVKRDTKGGGIITQYDGHYTPELGLLKMDFLGLRTLGVISRACDNVKERHGIEIDPSQIPLDDKASFDLMCGGNMDGLFQVEGNLYVTLFARMKPRRFSDVVASIALNRPGPLQNGFVDDYVDRVSGKKPVAYYDDRLRPILEETYGTIVYQEQLMQISMAMSGFSAGKADKLRKAMGKKKIEIMNALEDDWNNGAVENGYSLEVSKRIWSDAKKFAEYAFNKSHSACYAVLVMRTAYLKAHYPNEFMAAVLSSYLGNSDKLIHYIASCNATGIRVLPPDINSSNLEFTPVDEGVRFGLAGVRGVGEKVVEEIIEERKKGGPYTSLHNFVNRLDSKCYNRKTLEALIKAGAFDNTGYTRKQCMHFIEETALLEKAARRQKDRDAGQASMFDLFADEPDAGLPEDVPEPDGVEWDKRTKLAFEKEILKIYVSDHPLRPYACMLSRLSKFRLGDLAERTREVRNATFVGMISNVATKMTKKGTRMATFTLEDTTGHVECICFQYEKNADAIAEDAIVKVKGKYEVGDRNQLMAFEVERLELGDPQEDDAPRTLELRVHMPDMTESNLKFLSGILSRYPGGDGVVLYVRQPDGSGLRAVLPCGIDGRNGSLYTELHQLFGRKVWGRAS